MEIKIMTINMTRHTGAIGIPVAECIDKRFGTWRVRTDLQPLMNEETGDQDGVSFIEAEFPYKPSLDEAKEFVIGVIDAKTDNKILTGLVWNNKPVWLSAENQRNFSEGERKAKDNPSILPITYKIGETADKQPVYHTFSTVEEIVGFYDECFGYIQQCLTEGWYIKDHVNWTPYEEALEPVTEEV